MAQLIKSGKETPERTSEGRAIPIQWEGVEECPLIFSNNMLVQHTEHEFIITFAQVHPPLVLRDEDLAGIKSVRARAAVRVVLPPTRVPELIRILTENREKYIRRMGGATVEGKKGEKR
jgi:hypothetical protein